MDPAALIPMVSPIVATLVAYFKTEGATKIRDKATEVIGEKTGEAVVGVGPQALATLRGWFQKKADPVAQQALARVEHDPSDTASHQQLVQETARLAAQDLAMAQDLNVLAEQVRLAQSGGVLIENQASNEGAQGIFNAPITFNRVKE